MRTPAACVAGRGKDTCVWGEDLRKEVREKVRYSDASASKN